MFYVRSGSDDEVFNWSANHENIWSMARDLLWSETWNGDRQDDFQPLNLKA